MLTSRATLLGLLFSSTAFIAPGAAQAERKCYYPNGDEAAYDTPCTNADGFTACCADGYICMSNGLCHRDSDDTENDLIFDRGSCTDQSWESDYCPQFCTANQRGGGHSMLRCDDKRDRFVCITDDNSEPKCEQKNKYYEFEGE